MSVDIFMNCLRALDANIQVKNKKIIALIDQCSVHPREISVIKKKKQCVLSINLYWPSATPNHKHY
jgi:hypothetical protein